LQSQVIGCQQEKLNKDKQKYSRGFIRCFPKGDAVAEHLVNDVFKIPGPPRILQSDNGKEFAGIVKNICNILNVKIMHGRPRHPQSQGQIERLNQTIGWGFTKLLWDNHREKTGLT
jgi:transposase InsO family protein